MFAGRHMSELKPVCRQAGSDPLKYDLCGGLGCVFGLLPERNDARDEPVVPHVVNLRLKELNVFVNEVREAALLEQVVLDGQPLVTAFGDFSSLAVELEHSVFDFVQRPDAGVHGQIAELVGENGIEVPALGARVEAVNECGATDG